ncbi:MAG: hypothetical protein ACJAUU_001244 [Rickettsiales bacterium]|jgi:hypothetical protein
MTDQNPEENIVMPSKTMILLKASTIAMGIVFVVLLIAFLLIKQKRSGQKISKCADFLETQISGEIKEMKIDGSSIIILTKPNEAKTQEIIKINSNCAKIINRIQFNAF